MSMRTMTTMTATAAPSAYRRAYVRRYRAARYEALRRLGICSRCGSAEAREGRTRCEGCAARDAREKRERLARRRAGAKEAAR